VSVRLQRDALSVAAAYAELAQDRLGGVVVFAGRVRPDVGPEGRVVALDYEAHRPLARAALHRLAREARRRHPGARVVLWHRLGRLPVGTASVIVGAATPHRATAFALARWLIDRLKAEVPIWKTATARPARRQPRRPVRSGARSAG
jgi:molybdopterin synthase catalytic subunit